MANTTHAPRRATTATRILLLLATLLDAAHASYDDAYYADDVATPREPPPANATSLLLKNSSDNADSDCPVWALHEYAGVFTLKDVHTVRDHIIGRVDGNYTGYADANLSTSLSVYYLHRFGSGDADPNATYTNDTAYFLNLTLSDEEMSTLATASLVLGAGSVLVGSKLVLPVVALAGAIGGAFIFEEYLYDFYPTTDVGGDLSCAAAMLYVIFAALFGCMCAVVYFDVGLLAFQFFTGAAVASRVYVASLGSVDELVDHYFLYYTVVILAGMLTVGVLFEYYDQSIVGVTSLFGGNLVALSVHYFNHSSGSAAPPAFYLFLVVALFAVGMVVQPMMPDLLEDPMEDIKPGPGGGPSRRALRSFAAKKRKLREMLY